MATPTKGGILPARNDINCKIPIPGENNAIAGDFDVRKFMEEYKNSEKSFLDFIDTAITPAGGFGSQYISDKAITSNKLCLQGDILNGDTFVTGASFTNLGGTFVYYPPALEFDTEFDFSTAYVRFNASIVLALGSTPPSVVISLQRDTSNAFSSPNIIQNNTVGNGAHTSVSGRSGTYQNTPFWIDDGVKTVGTRYYYRICIESSSNAISYFGNNSFLDWFVESNGRYTV
jgi:hypothetical protein